VTSAPADRSRAAEARQGPGASDAAPDPRVVPPPPGRHRVRMTIAYRGGGFRGMAANAGVRTVAGTLVAALEPVLGVTPAISVAGRTDAGVHAWGQVVSFDVADDAPAPDVLARAVNARCAPELVVRHAVACAPTFDARFSARRRTYRYRVLNGPVPDPFLADVALWVPRPLDLAALRLSCDPVIGRHDFGAFCRRPKGDEGHGGDRPGLERRVLDARWSAVGADELRFEISATAFCHQMVRSIVGTMVEMGTGQRRPGEMAAILRSADRAAAGQVAPPHGLCLWEVGYA
jgi:tRNA pseudouridine38-40 synthase